MDVVANSSCDVVENIKFFNTLMIFMDIFEIILEILMILIVALVFYRMYRLVQKLKRANMSPEKLNEECYSRQETVQKFLKEFENASSETRDNYMNQLMEKMHELDIQDPSIKTKKKSI